MVAAYYYSPFLFVTRFNAVSFVKLYFVRARTLAPFVVG
jgi:hypothetical protein